MALMTESSADVIVEVDRNIGYITLNRPEKRNALSLQMMRKIIDWTSGCD